MCVPACVGEESEVRLEGREVDGLRGWFRFVFMGAMKGMGLLRGMMGGWGASAVEGVYVGGQV